jgi:hypothetical protein
LTIGSWPTLHSQQPHADTTLFLIKITWQLFDGFWFR